MGFEIRLGGLVNDSITDGPGLRYSIFVQGCPLCCEGCQNPQFHDFEAGSICDTDELLEEIRRNPILSGITLTGGEPMCQAGALSELAEECKQAGLEVAIYTGYTFEHLLREGDADRMRLLHLSDILIDGPFIQSQRSLDIGFRGSRNQRILNLSRSMQTGLAVAETSQRWTPNPVRPMGRDDLD